MHLVKRKLYNLSAGPAPLPESILDKAQQAIENYDNTGLSILELSHRSDFLDQIHDQLVKSIKRLVNIPENYHVLLLQGGATVQFSMIPLNLLGSLKSAGYLMTGEWSQRSYQAARKYYPVTAIPVDYFNESDLIQPVNELYKYIHLTSNETADGIEWDHLPNTYDVSLVADMSSNLFTKPLSVIDYGLIYASCQKNIGIAGLTLVIVDEKLLEPNEELLPNVFNYRNQIIKKSTYNTPLLLSWYITTCVLDWIHEKGGLSVIAEENLIKAKLVYDYLEHSKLFKNNVPIKWRSRINIVLQMIPEADLSDFLNCAKQEGFINIAGHASHGGIRISLYNVISINDVKAFITFLSEYERKFFHKNSVKESE